MSNRGRLEEKVSIVTGAAQGIGEAAALLNETERPMPLTTIDQLLVVSRRVRQILLWNISPR